MSKPVGPVTQVKSAAPDMPPSARIRDISLPRWNMVAATKAVRQPDGGAIVHAINDAGHAVELHFSRELWIWTSTREEAAQ